MKMSSQKIGRWQLFEFHDFSWFPDLIRGYMLEIIAWTWTGMNLAKAIAPTISDVISRTNSIEITDLCSGAGGPWHGENGLYNILSRDYGHTGLEVILSDIAPNQVLIETLKKAKGLVSYHETPVNAMNTPPEIEKSLLTLFTCFHHFSPTGAKQIIQNAVTKNLPIAIIEPQQRSLYAMFTVLMLFFVAWLISPFLKPFSKKRMFFTYFVPIVPLILVFDGIMSCLRTYTTQELSLLASEVKGHENFEWKSGIVRRWQWQWIFPSYIQYFIGIPKKKN